MASGDIDKIQNQKNFELTEKENEIKNYKKEIEKLKNNNNKELNQYKLQEKELKYKLQQKNEIISKLNGKSEIDDSNDNNNNEIDVEKIRKEAYEAGRNAALQERDDKGMATFIVPDMLTPEKEDAIEEAKFFASRGKIGGSSGSESENENDNENSNENEEKKEKNLKKNWVIKVNKDKVLSSDGKQASQMILKLSEFKNEENIIPQLKAVNIYYTKGAPYDATIKQDFTPVRETIGIFQAASNKDMMKIKIKNDSNDNINDNKNSINEECSNNNCGYGASYSLKEKLDESENIIGNFCFNHIKDKGYELSGILTKDLKSKDIKKDEELQIGSSNYYISRI